MKTLLSRRALILAVFIAALALPASASAVNPEMTWTSPSSNQFFGNTLYITGTSANVDLGILDYTIDGDAPVYLNADPENPRTVYIAVDIAGLVEGQHVVQGHAFPVGGAIDGSSGFSNFYKQFIVEHSIPDLTFDSSIADGANTAVNDFTWTFNSIDAGAYRCSIDGLPDQACSSPVTLNDLPDGQHSFYVYARDQAGNESPAQGVEFNVNALWSSPPITVITGKPGATDPVTVADFSFASLTASTFECRVDDGPFAACTSPHSVSGLTPGAHTFGVRGTDPTGQLGPTSQTAYFTIAAARIIPVEVPPALPAPKISVLGAKKKLLSVTVSGPGSVAVKVETCVKKKGRNVCKKFTSGTATATVAGKLTITLKKSLKKKSKYRFTCTSTSPSSTGETAKSVATIKAK